MNYRQEITRLEAAMQQERMLGRQRDRRLSKLERRCAELEQATLEIAALVRQVSPEGLGSLPSPSGDDSRIPA